MHLWLRGGRKQSSRTWLWEHPSGLHRLVRTVGTTQGCPRGYGPNLTVRMSRRLCRSLGGRTCPTHAPLCCPKHLDRVELEHGRETLQVQQVDEPPLARTGRQLT